MAVRRDPGFVISYSPTLKSRLASVVVAGSLLTAFACARPNFVLAPGKPDRAQSPGARLTENAVLVSIDGLRPDAIAAFSAPTLQRLIKEGSYTLSARTILPSKTLPSHTSMLTGEPPDRHGVLWNTAIEDAPGTIEIPTGLRRCAGTRLFHCGFLQQVEVLAPAGAGHT